MNLVIDWKEGKLGEIVNMDIEDEGERDENAFELFHYIKDDGRDEFYAQVGGGAFAFFTTKSYDCYSDVLMAIERDDFYDSHKEAGR